jgi:hypothetical protein
MPLVVPDAKEVVVLTDILTPALTLKLYSNDVTPSGSSVAADFTEVAGGGYANKPLTFANWGITPGNPTVGLYNAVQSWVFTGPTNAPGTIYGYYVIRNSDGLLQWAQRFSTAPFSPIAGSVIRITPRITCHGG